MTSISEPMCGIGDAKVGISPIMRTLLALLLVCVLSGCAPASAQAAWNAAALDDLEAVAASTEAEGLPAEADALEELARLRHLSDVDAAAEAQVDAAADTLFADLARIFAQGGADPAAADPDWAIPRAAPPDLDALSAARAAGASPSSLLRPLLPQHADYAALRDELARLRAGERRSDIHIDQLRASLERWRWLPRVLPPRRLEVHIAQFELRAFESGAQVRVHKVIVGAPSTPTPSFAADINAVTINPAWEPPASIAAELLARFRRDPGAAEREGFEALGRDGGVIATPDWSERPFPYRLRQRPGPANALGAVRFDIPNAFAIRLHDTPSRTLFARDNRAFSHGCIRVQEPEDLAAFALAGETWRREDLIAAAETGQTQILRLAEPLPVILIYITAAPGADGAVAYARDVYGRDRAIIAALDTPDATSTRRAAAALPNPCDDSAMP